MPLSEEEQRLLDEMERNLYGHSTDVHGASTSRGRVSSRGIAFGLAGIGLGVLGLVAGMATGFFVWGLLGFALMIGGCVSALSMRERIHDASSSTSRQHPNEKNQGFMQRLEDRWDSRE